MQQQGIVMDEKLSVNEAAVRRLAALLEETNVTEIEYEDEGCRIRVARSSFAAPAMMHAPALPAAAPVAVPAAVQDPAQNPGAVKSPMVGTVYHASQPGAEPFVKVGDQVQEGQTLLIIEAMKVMNYIKAPRAGKVTSILVADLSPVEYDQALLIIQ